MNVASEAVAVLMSACSLLMFSFAISSSRTFKEVLFSFVVDMLADAEAELVAAGMF